MTREQKGRLLWFAALWLLGVAALALLAVLARLLLHAF
jgi:hypothetical protein